MPAPPDKGTRNFWACIVSRWGAGSPLGPHWGCARGRRFDGPPEAGAGERARSRGTALTAPRPGHLLIEACVLGTLYLAAGDVGLWSATDAWLRRFASKADDALPGPGFPEGARAAGFCGGETVPRRTIACYGDGLRRQANQLRATLSAPASSMGTRCERGGRGEGGPVFFGQRSAAGPHPLCTFEGHRFRLYDDVGGGSRKIGKSAFQA